MAWPQFGNDQALGGAGISLSGEVCGSQKTLYVRLSLTTGHGGVKGELAQRSSRLLAWQMMWYKIPKRYERDSARVWGWSASSRVMRPWNHYGAAELYREIVNRG
jgi:hypothetical protein